MSARFLLPIVAFAVFLPVLAGCETVGNWVDGGDKVAVNNSSVTPVSNTLAQPPSTSAPLSENELRNLTSKYSGGSVEVFDIGGGSDNRNMISIASQPSPYGAASDMARGTAYSGDPSVTVFPLDGPVGGYGSTSSHMPMVPAPFADIANPAIGGGKPSASVGKDVSRVYFEYGSAHIGSGDERVLRDAAEAAKFAPVDRIRVEGHASVHTQTNDPVKARILNLKESMNRAYKVSQQLIEKGVPAEKIKTVAWGDTVPAASDKEQRRVDIITGAGQ